jgi:hypothetical protein
MTVLDVGFAVAVALMAAVVASMAVSRRRTPGRAAAARPGRHRRILVPFTGADLDAAVLAAAIRIARAEDAVLVPVYLLIVPLAFAEDTPLADEVARAMPLLEAVEQAALRAGVEVDARIEKGRTATHALQRLFGLEPFERVLVPAPRHPGAGFTPKDLAWILTRAPFETLVLRPANGATPGI